MGAVFVVVADVLGEQPFHMIFIDRDRKGLAQLLDDPQTGWMVTQKRQPALGWIWVCGNSFHPARNGSFGDIKTEHQKFAVDAGSSPARVLGHHLEDEIPNLFRCLSPTDVLPGLRNHPPVATESGAVPSRDGFGCDDEEHLFPA